MKLNKQIVLNRNQFVCMGCVSMGRGGGRGLVLRKFVCYPFVLNNTCIVCCEELIYKVGRA